MPYNENNAKNAVAVIMFLVMATALAVSIYSAIYAQKLLGAE